MCRRCPYLQHAVHSLRTERVWLSLTHGELLTSAFQQSLYDSLGKYAVNENADQVVGNIY
jgi:hypothetical protein